MTGEIFLEGALIVTIAILILSFLLIVLRIVLGPTLLDRILALDLLVAVVIGFIAVFGVRSGFTVYVDIAIALGLVGFLSTVALARFVIRRGDVAIEERPALGRVGLRRVSPKAGQTTGSVDGGGRDA